MITGRYQGGGGCYFFAGPSETTPVKRSGRSHFLPISKISYFWFWQSLQQTPHHLYRGMPLPSLSALGGSDDTSTPVLDVVGLDGEDEQELYEQPPPGPSLGERHSVDDEPISPLTAEQKAEAARCLRCTTMFKFCSDESIMSIVQNMRREQFSEGEVCAIPRISCLFPCFKNLD